MLLLYLVYSAFAQSSQSLVYDLTYKGQPVGIREITIQYLPATENSPHGSRMLESWTEFEAVVAGKKIVYKQRATGHFSDRKSRFVSAVTVNDQHFELQGKQERGEGWTIHEINSKGVTSTEYKAYEVNDISLALFDPGQSESWQDKSLTKIYHVEMGEVWMGEWIELQDVQVTTIKETVTGKQLRYHSPDGELDAAWSDTGIVIDWTLRVLGVELEADIRNIPELPQFGNIEQFESFQGVKEEEL